MSGHLEKPRILWHIADVTPDTGALRVEVRDAYEEWLEEFQVRLAVRHNETQADGLGLIAFDGTYITVANVLGREERVRAELERVVADAHTAALAHIERAGGRAQDELQPRARDAQRSERRFRSFE